MKRLLLILGMLHFTILCSGQNNIQLNTAWKELATQFQRKTDLAIVLASHMAAFKQTDSTLNDLVKESARDLSVYLANKQNPDSLIVGATFIKNQVLSKNLGSLLMHIEKYRDIKEDEKTRNLNMQLMGMENRIFIAVKRYNELCMLHHRPELMFKTGISR